MSLAEIRQLPKQEKFLIMETLWAELSSNEGYECPAWHAEELKKTQEDLIAGRVEKIDWEMAKSELRKCFA